MADSPEEIKKALKLYWFIGGCLFFGTIMTVLVATVPMFDVGGHGFDGADAALGLFIATMKASAVAFIFMHLSSEKKLIHWIFFGSLVFGAILILLFAFGFLDPITFDEMMPKKVH